MKQYTKLQFADYDDFKEFFDPANLNDIEYFWPDVRVWRDDRRMRVLIEGMSEEGVLFSCMCIRSCFNEGQCWVVKD